MVKIDNDIPAPVSAVTSGRKHKYPFRQLQVGQSFGLPLSDDVTVKQMKNAAAAARKRAKAEGVDLKFVVAERAVDIGGEFPVYTEVRVWRTA